MALYPHLPLCTCLVLFLPGLLIMSFCNKKYCPKNTDAYCHLSLKCYTVYIPKLLNVVSTLYIIYFRNKDNSEKQDSKISTKICNIGEFFSKCSHNYFLRYYCIVVCTLFILKGNRTELSWLVILKCGVELTLAIQLP